MFILMSRESERAFFYFIVSVTSFLLNVTIVLLMFRYC
jgi:hypothetical protein